MTFFFCCVDVVFSAFTFWKWHYLSHLVRPFVNSSPTGEATWNFGFFAFAPCRFSTHKNDTSSRWHWLKKGHNQASKFSFSNFQNVPIFKTFQISERSIFCGLERKLKKFFVVNVVSSNPDVGNFFDRFVNFLLMYETHENIVLFFFWFFI